MTVLNEIHIWALWCEALLLEMLVEKDEAQEGATVNHDLGIEERLERKSKN